MSVGTGDATIVGTDEHPFWSLSRDQWVEMGHLGVGERLLLSDGTETTVTTRKVEYAVSGRATMGSSLNDDGFFTVYNFRVADWHTYHASPNANQPAVWVHNANEMYDVIAKLKEMRKEAGDFNKHPKTTVIGRMDDVQHELFHGDPGIDSWAKSGRIPGDGDIPVDWFENRAWLKERIRRGDDFLLATDRSTLPPVKNGYVPGKPNGYFTARELEFLESQGVNVKNCSVR
ncbi:polymorphic toxin-type HINT domain-containing protein [Planctomycetota bacterium]|nr:polymorphic toxin-type HINT domain-containing protein [Planctomycetota bacterium]